MNQNNMKMTDMVLEIDTAGPASYEAEASENTLSGEASICSKSICYGEKCVGHIGNGGTLTFNNVYVETAGIYTMTICYQTEEQRDFYVSVNNGIAVVVTCPAATWDKYVQYTTIAINLNSGNNTIKFYNTSAPCPELDRIIINPGDDIVTVSGDYYDYTQTNAPERPYLNDYTKTLTMKMHLADPDQCGGTNVLLTFEQALQKIIEVDNITLGIPKIIYLVGWQYNGHDDKYPAWEEVNPALKRPEDATALDSYLWLKNEAAKYNTKISVHINMDDAYMDSPLWSIYVENDLIARNSDGSFYQLGLWNGIYAYQVCFTREWDTGYAKRRIDRIIDMLQLASVGTVHIDAYHTRTSAYHGITEDMEAQAQRKIIRYWRDKGVDFTNEHFTTGHPDPFIGLSPMAWLFDLSRDQQISIHQQLACGGVPFPYNSTTAETGFLFGQSMWGEDLFSKSTFVTDFEKQFATTMLQSYYQNTRSFVSYSNNTTNYTGALTINANDYTVKENGRLLRSNNDVFIPVAWKTTKEILVYSELGYDNKTWTLPTDWEGVAKVDMYNLVVTGATYKCSYSVIDNSVTISLPPLGYVFIVPGTDTVPLVKQPGNEVELYL